MSAEDLIIDENHKVKGAVALDKLTGKKYTIKAKKVINATGVFSDRIRQKANGNLAEKMVLSKGEHISVKMLKKMIKEQKEIKETVSFNPYNSSDGLVPSGILIPKTKDGRVLFILNWKDHLIAGTTDKQEPKSKLTSHIEWDDEGVEQISGEIRRMFEVDEMKVQSVWAGHRPLIKAEGSSKELARTHVIEVDKHSGLISILGGKWTIFRKMGEEGVDKALDEMFKEGIISEEEYQEKQKRSTKNLRFVGDYRSKLYDLNEKQERLSKSKFHDEGIEILTKQFPKISRDIIEYLYKNYGMRSEMILREMAKGGKKARIFDRETKLGYAEVEHLLKYEFCTQVMDILGRRTRLSFFDREKARRWVTYFSN